MTGSSKTPSLNCDAAGDEDEKQAYRPNRSSTSLKLLCVLLPPPAGKSFTFFFGFLVLSAVCGGAGAGVVLLTDLTGEQ